MIRLFTLAILCFISLHLQAQISHGGKPFDWEENRELSVEFISLPPINQAALEREDFLNDAVKEIPYRFGENIPVDLDINNSGEWITLENGDRVWRLGIISEGAVSLNFVFDQYHLPKGGKVFVYDTDKKQLLGSFTSENASKENVLGVGFVLSDRIIISYHEPADVARQGYLHINKITHGYRNAFANVDGIEKSGPFGTAGACNVNVNCPVGLPYGIQKRSVGLIVVNGNSKCTGALVNTTAQDERPYFLTARHCLGAVNMDSTWVFYFNHETPDCEGQGIAPINQSVSGATLLAKNNESDFALLELNNAVPVDYNVCYSGWDATDNASNVTSAYGIHHPKGDVKKISIDEDAPTKTIVSTNFLSQVWFVNQWELGVTEGGSSGSPLFSQSGLIIGQLGGGESMCIGTNGNNGYDIYGRIGVSWEYGTTPATRLMDWLDPINSGEMIVGNSCTGLEPVNDASLAEIIGIPQTTCDLEPIEPSINILNSGSESITSLTLEIVVNGEAPQEMNWIGNIEVFSSAFIDLGAINPTPGSNTYKVEILSVNGESDDIPSGNVRTREFYGFSSAQVTSFQITLDDYPHETSWRIENQNGDTLYAGSGTNDIAQITEDICIGIGCYKFIIRDTSGDGICCSYGQGSYLLTDEYGNTLASGGNFSFSETTEFCITTVNDSETEKEFIHVFPNPTSGKCHIVLGDTANSIKSIRVVDATGRVLKYADNFRPNSRVWTFDSEGFAVGIYLVLIESSVRTEVKRVVVIR